MSTSASLSTRLAVVRHPLLWILLATPIAALTTGFGHEYAPDPVIWLLDTVGFLTALLGLAWVRRGSAAAPAGRELLPEALAILAGVLLIMGRPLLAAVAAAGWVALQARAGRATRDSLAESVRRNGALLCGVTAALCGLGLWRGAVGPGGFKTSPFEMSTFGICLSLAGVAWGAARDGLAAFGVKSGTGLKTRLPEPAKLLVAAVALFAAFLAVAYAIHLPTVSAWDEAAVHGFYHSGGAGMTKAMRTISGLGGRNLAVQWIPLITAALAVTRRWASIRLFLATMLGSFGVETVFKLSIGRQRPDLVTKLAFDSFPSGHTLAAAMLAFVLLALLLPACRKAWQQVPLWGVALVWPVLMGASRVYTGRHYPTDVLGGILLGGAWVCFCCALFLLLDRARFGRPAPPAPQSWGESQGTPQRDSALHLQ